MDEAPSFGPYVMKRAIEPARFGPSAAAPGSGTATAMRRWVALHERHHTSHLVYILDGWNNRFAIRRFLEAADDLSLPAHPHVLSLEAYSLCAKRGCCMVAAYPGDQTGLLDLRRLLSLKGGRMNQAEVLRAAGHVLSGLDHVHSLGRADGALDMDRILIDPRGCLRIELPGLWRRMVLRTAGGAAAMREDVAAAARIVHRLLTGIDSPSGPSLAGVRGLDPQWSAWFVMALSPIDGFATAAEALAALPRIVSHDVEVPRAESGEQPKVGVVRSLLDRLKGFVPLL